MQLACTWWNMMHSRYFIEIFLAVCVCEQITSVSQCVWFTGHREVLWNVNHCLGMQESPFFSEWKLNILNILGRRIVVRFEGGLCLITRSVTNDDASAAFIGLEPVSSTNPDSREHLIPLPQWRLLLSGSLNAVCSCSVRFFFIRKHTGKILFWRR